ncbi:ferric reductase-like transmembrane domain-containing protein [Saccharomonospora cyanea]|uniref:Putative ferric reductase n=1 Tax=Saccharomonospora cyanea NA-134 TaxID=882082 RepID=H5XDH3_9PSEU|nr:ferric reductase-like transmembrane domain-containing protein [Saccharomonospora cyanea]EHR60265.1 putative ferric reductase [Saccharomonospora cyanea NA-134]
MTGPAVEGRPTRRGTGLRADLRVAVFDASAALLVTLGLFAWLTARIASGESPTLAVMPFLADAGQYWLYWLCQAFGWSALLWAWLTTMLGLIRSSARPSWLRVAPARVERWHRATSLTTIGLMFAHAAAFFAELVREGDGVWASFVQTFVPGGYTSGTGRVAILLGLLAFYLAIPLGLAFYVRDRLGARLWRALHRCILVVYVLSVWHTLLYGTNVWFDGWPRTTLWVLQLPVAVLLLARVVAPARPVERWERTRGLVPVARRVGALLLAAGTVVVLVLVVVTGRDGGRPLSQPAPASVVDERGQ